MKKCTELLKNGARSLVEVLDIATNEVEKYVVCTNFDNAKAYGSKWDWGHYFDIWSGATREEQMKAAAMFLYDKREPIPYARLSEIATLLKDGLMEDDEESAIEFMKETCELTKEEAEYFGVEKELYPTKYKIVQLTMKREQYATIKVAVPENTDIYSNYEDYVGNTTYLEPDWGSNEEWELDDWKTLNDDVTPSDINSRYSEEDLWNYNDYEEQ